MHAPLQSLAGEKCASQAEDAAWDRGRRLGEKRGVASRLPRSDFSADGCATVSYKLVSVWQLTDVLESFMPVTTNPAVTGVPVESNSNPVKIRMGGRDVLANGTVLVSDSQDVEMSIGPIEVVFSFALDPALGTVIRHNVDGMKLTLTLVNFRGQGAGTSQPYQVGLWLGRLLYVSLSVNTLPPPNTTRVMHYMFSLGDAT